MVIFHCYVSSPEGNFPNKNMIQALQTLEFWSSVAGFTQVGFEHGQRFLSSFF